MSPTPSPAGSVGSVGSLGSQGSNNCDASGNTLLPSSLPQVQGNKLTNGVPHIMSSPANVSVPQSIVNKMSTFIQTSNYGYYGLDFWEQADTLAQENIGKWKASFLRSCCYKIYLSTFILRVCKAVSLVEDHYCNERQHFEMLYS